MTAVTISCFPRRIFVVSSTLFHKILPWNRLEPSHLQKECLRLQFGTLSAVKIKKFWIKTENFWLIFSKGNRKLLLFTFLTELSTKVASKCHLLKTKAKKRGFWKTNIHLITLFCFASLSLPPACVGGERGMGLKFGGKGKQFRLKISSEKLHQIGA